MKKIILGIITVSLLSSCSSYPSRQIDYDKVSVTKYNTIETIKFHRPNNNKVYTTSNKRNVYVKRGDRFYSALGEIAYESLEEFALKKIKEKKVSCISFRLDKQIPSRKNELVVSIYKTNCNENPVATIIKPLKHSTTVNELLTMSSSTMARLFLKWG